MAVPLERITKFVQSVEPSATLDTTHYTFDNIVALYVTPDGSYQGLIAKAPLDENPVMKRAVSKEAEALLSFQSRSNDKSRYKVPNLIAYSHTMPLLVEQRLFGPTVLEKIKSDKIELSQAVNDMFSWTDYFHGAKERTSYTVSQTQSWKEFMERLKLDIARSASRDLINLGKAVEDYGIKQGSSDRAYLHGDNSPIHIFYEPSTQGQSDLYGIDFNGSRWGIADEDLGSLVSNTYFHFSDLLPQRQIVESLENALNRYAVDKNNAGFYIAKSFYDKARMADEPQKSRFLGIAMKSLANKFHSEYLLQ